MVEKNDFDLFISAMDDPKSREADPSIIKVLDPEAMDLNDEEIKALVDELTQETEKSMQFLADLKKRMNEKRQDKNSMTISDRVRQKISSEVDKNLFKMLSGQSKKKRVQ